MPTNKIPEYKYVVIDDFRQGIVSSVRSAATKGGSLDTLKPGAAQEGTFGCIANETGQLVPLPSASIVTTFAPGSAGFAIDNTKIGTCGIATFGPIQVASQTNNDDVIILLQYIAVVSGVSHECYQSFVYKGGQGVPISIQILTGRNTTDLTRRGSTIINTRGRRSNFNTPGFPIMGWEYTSGLSGIPFVDGSIAQYVIYPDPNSPNTDSPYGETYTVDNPTNVYGGQLVAHSGRILRLCEAQTSAGLNVGFDSNERIRYTDPPGNITLNTSTTDSIIDPQSPGGFGSWGSISYGELLLIKRSGGALLIEGDIYAPQITRLAGVASTGNIMNEATACATGLIYCVENDGAYLWAGGALAEKISTINDGFHTPAIPLAQGRKTDHTNWNNWVVFTNGYLYDSVNNSWWQLQNNFFTQGNVTWVAAGKGSAQYMWALAGSDNGTGNIELLRYDRNTPGSIYTWISQPIPVSMNRTIDIKEATFSFSNVLSSTNVVITVSSINGASAAEHFTLNASTQPVRLRLPIGYVGNAISLTVSCTRAGGPPTLNSIAIGYEEALPFSPTGSYAV